MRLIVTSDCESHHTNQLYQTLLVEFEATDTNLRPLGLTGNWQPRDDEVIEICEVLAGISPTFKTKLYNLIYTINVSDTNTPSKPRKKVGSFKEFTDGMFQ